MRLDFYKALSDLKSGKYDSEYLVEYLTALYEWFVYYDNYLNDIEDGIMELRFLGALYSYSFVGNDSVNWIDVLGLRGVKEM